MRKISAIQYTALIIIFLALAMNFIYYYNTGNNNSPIIKFEFSENTQEINNLFLENNELKNDVIAGVNDQNIIDYAYMIAYSSFLILIFIRLLKTEGKNIYYLGILLSVLAVISDLIENIQMFYILEMLVSKVNFSEHIIYLRIFTWIKWLSLSFALMIMSFHYFKYKLSGKLFAVISILPIVTVLLTRLNILSDYDSYFTYSVMLGFVILMTWSFISVLVSSSVSFYKRKA